MAGRPRDDVVLTEDERAALLMWTRSRTCSQARALRAQIVLACEDEPTNTAVAHRLGVSRDMVGKWRARFLAERLDGLDEQPRPGRPPTADDDTVAHVLVRTLTPPPPGARRSWSTRSMAAETGLSQSTVSRIWRTYRVQPGEHVTAGPRRAWSLPDHAEEIVGLHIAPPVCVLAVTARAGRDGAARPAAATAAGRLFGQDREAPHVLAVACAFAALRGKQHTEDAPGGPAMRAFVERARSAAGAGEVVHLLAHGIPAQARHTVQRPDTAARRHHVPGLAAWTEEIQRLLAADAPLPREASSDLPRLRDALLSWSTTWTPSAAPFTRIATPRPSYDNPSYGGTSHDGPAICGSDNDSNAGEARALGHPAVPAARRIASGDAPPGAPITSDPVVGLLREAVLAGGHQPGDRVREAPLAVRLGVSRRVVRAGLRALADEGMLEHLPGGAAAVPTVTAKDVLDLYALRASLGALLVRRVAMLGPENLAPASAALAEVRSAARDNDHARIREVDLRYQDALARIADLPQAAGTFERLTARLRMFVNVLDMDYSQACDTIAGEDTAVHDALRDADGNEAARLWRVKIERCVRYMIAQLPEDDVAPHVWTTLAGRPRLRPGIP
ncbi:helix-turn-helix domain-containing protein [Streptomyces spongiae]|uniref:GntR family transcriptional regulator n=1 Tax=Streptomyces spongiae TaxID=565072 RepID=A0A5N8XCV2_9ACTN|nr:helix-turn-helix domain-containing protein [Streptomyces spongiae]MPY57237.1 GntR family transcriptional regulator [Streptomyces spongiae]